MFSKIQRYFVLRVTRLSRPSISYEKAELGKIVEKSISDTKYKILP